MNYRRLAKALHPDKNLNKPSATASFQSVVIRKLATDLNHLQDKDDEQLREERQRDSWWTYITSPIYGKLAKETEEQKQQQEFDRIQRLSTRRIKENDLVRQAGSVQTLKDKLQDVKGKIATVKEKNEEVAQAREAKKQERIRKDQEAKRQAEHQEARERLAKMRAEWAQRKMEGAVRAAKQAREAQEAQEAWEADERIRHDQAARETQQTRHRERRARLTRASAHPTGNNRSKPATTVRSSVPKKIICQHNAFWPKCPGCKMIACAKCRQNLRGERAR
ncbi:MAG: hypothetical protein Q9181_006301 [Wetmoreana brouardii]